MPAQHRKSARWGPVPKSIPPLFFKGISRSTGGPALNAARQAGGRPSEARALSRSSPYCPISVTDQKWDFGLDVRLRERRDLSGNGSHLLIEQQKSYAVGGNGVESSSSMVSIRERALPVKATWMRRASFGSGLRVSQPSLVSSLMLRSAVVGGTLEAVDRLVSEIARPRCSARYRSRNMSQTGSAERRNPMWRPTARRWASNISHNRIRRIAAFLPLGVSSMVIRACPPCLTDPSRIVAMEPRIPPDRRQLLKVEGSARVARPPFCDRMMSRERGTSNSSE